MAESPDSSDKNMGGEPPTRDSSPGPSSEVTRDDLSAKTGASGPKSAKSQGSRTNVGRTTVDAPDGVVADDFTATAGDVTRQQARDKADAPVTLHTGDPSSTTRDAFYATGVEVGNYRIIEVIARGGMGVVYKANQKTVDRVVALKMILSGHHASDEQVKRFYSEAKAVAKLAHQSIVPIYEIGEIDGCPFFSMEFVEGESLSKRIHENPLPSRAAAGYVRQMAEAISFAHGEGVLHRDLKPSNILINSQDQVRITDFGLAKQIEDDTELTASGAIIGTPSYMSPEQAIGDQSAVGESSDIYSLGATLYTLLTGRPPFQAPTTAQTIMLVVQGSPVPPRQLNAAIDPDIETICLKCLAREPKHRYESSSALAEDLRRYLDGETILARRANLIERGYRWARRNPIPTALAFAVLFGLLATFAAITMNARSQRYSRLAELERRFETRLDKPTLSTDYIDSMALLAEEVERLEPSSGERLRRRLVGRYDSFVSDQINQPRISEEHREEIKNAIVYLSGQFPEYDVESAITRLTESTFQWNGMAFLEPPYDELSQVFPANAVQVRDSRLMRSEQYEAIHHNLLSAVKSSGDIIVEAEFWPDWSDRRLLGLSIDCGFDSSGNLHRYELVIQAEQQDRSLPTSRLPTMREQIENSKSLQISIRRDEMWLGYRELTVAVDEPLLMTFRREGRTLSFHVNDESPLEIEELFPLFWKSDRSVLGLVDSRGADSSFDGSLALKDLRVQRRQNAFDVHPIEEGDQQFAAGNFSEALELYRTAASQLDNEFENELQYKSAMCLYQLNRLAESESILVPLANSEDVRWRFRALAQIWLLNLERGQFEEAELVVIQLMAERDFEEMLVQLPPGTIEKLLQFYLERGPGRIDNLRVSKPESFDRRLAELERAAKIVRILGASVSRVTDVHLQLAGFYILANRPEEAIRLTEFVLDEYAESLPNLQYPLEYYAQAMFAMGREQQAIEHIRTYIIDENGRAIESKADLILLLGDCYLASGELDSALSVFRHLYRIEDQFKYPGHRLDLRLLYGLAEERKGNSEHALELWNEVLTETRQWNSNALWITSAYAISAGLTGKVTEEDAAKLASAITEDQIGGPLINSFRKDIASDAQIASVIRHVWNQPGGREMLKYQIQRPYVYNPQANRFIARHFLLEIARQVVGGLENADSFQLSEIEKEAFLEGYDVVEQLLVDREIGHLEGTRALMSLKGTTGLLGWTGLANSVPETIVPQLGYILACYLDNESKPDAARIVLEDVLNRIDSNEPLKPFIEERLADLN